MGFTFDFNKPAFGNVLDADLDQIRDNWHYILSVCAQGSLVIPGWQTTAQGDDLSQPDSITLTRGTKKIIIYYTWVDNSVTSIQFCYDNGVGETSPSVVCYPAIGFYYDSEGNPVGTTDPTAPLFQDDFVDTNGTLLTAHTPDIGSGAWYLVSGTSPTIQSNSCASNGTTECINQTDLGTGDYTLTCKIWRSSGILAGGIRFRIGSPTSNADCWMLWADGSNFVLSRRTGGSTVWSQNKTPTGYTSRNAQDVKIVCSGANITITAVDVDEVIYTVTNDTWNATNPYIGLRFYDLGGTAYLQNVLVTP